MSVTLKSKAMQGAFWSLLERVGQQGISFFIAMILARLLLPAQFGLVGMLSIFIEVARVFVDSGFGAALIQRKKMTDIDASSIFYFNVLVGLLAMGLLCAVAPWVAGFYHEPILTPLMRALSVTILINSFAGVQTALLSKRIDFKTQLKVSVTATLLSGVIGTAMAFRGFGVWSLVAQYISSSLFRTVLLWCLNTWRPKLIFRFAVLREMFGFGSNLLASTLLNTFFENIYLVVIGRLFSAASLGLYAGARRIQNVITINLTAGVMQVAFPVFSTLQDDPARLKRSVRKAMTTLALVNFPILVGLMLVARPIVIVLLTEKWAAAIPWLQLMCVADLLYPFQSLHLNVLKALGRSDLFFYLEVIKKILIMILIAATYHWGVTGLLYGQIVMSVLGYYINSYYMTRLIGYPWQEQLADLAPYAGISALMGGGVYLVRLVPFAGDALLLLVEVLLGVALYVALSYVFRLPAFLETLHAVRQAVRARTLSYERS